MIQGNPVIQSPLRCTRSRCFRLPGVLVLWRVCGTSVGSREALSIPQLERHVELPVETLRRYSPSLVIPLPPNTSSLSILEQFMKSPQLCKHPRLRVKRVYADFETSKHDKKYWHSKRGGVNWPVYAGESFDIWTPDTGRYYAFTLGVRR